MFKSFQLGFLKIGLQDTPINTSRTQSIDRSFDLQLLITVDSRFKKDFGSDQKLSSIEILSNITNTRKPSMEP